MTSPLALGVITLGLLVCGLALYRFYPRTAPANAGGKGAPKRSAVTEIAPNPKSDSAEDLTARFYALLLKSQSQDAQGIAQLNDAFSQSWETMMQDQTLFPRQPMVLPKLLQAMRSETQNSEALMAIVLEDPGLTTDVLKLANSPVYRNTQKEIQSLEYALVVLGLDGMHALVCSCVMKPIFSKQRGEGFNGSLFWEWALNSAQGAQYLLVRNKSTEAATGYLLSLLTRLSELIILRTCVRLGQDMNLVCGTQQVLPIITQYRYQIAEKLIQDWGLDLSLCRLLPQEDDSNPKNSDLVQSQLLAPALGSAAVLVSRDVLALDDLSAELRQFCEKVLQDDAQGSKL